MNIFMARHTPRHICCRKMCDIALSKFRKMCKNGIAKGRKMCYTIVDSRKEGDLHEKKCDSSIA